MSPQDTLKEAGIAHDILKHARPGESRQGDEMYTATPRYIDPKGVLALGYLTAAGWAVTIDVRRGATGVLITMTKGAVTP